MRRTIIITMIAALGLLVQSCSKTANAPINSKGTSTTGSSSDPSGGTTGLKLDAVGDYGIYQIITYNLKTAEIANSSTAVGGTTAAVDYIGSPFQKWKITRVSDKYYTIKNIGSGLYLQSYNYNGTDIIIQNKANGSDAQLWSLGLVGTKKYKGINKADNLAATANGAGMVQLQTFSNQTLQTWAYNQLANSDTAKTVPFTVSNLLGSNMVVQRDKPFNVWGNATPGSTVSVKVSWNSSTFKGVVDNNNNWLVTIPSAPANSNAQTITATVDGQPAITLNNILIGDVWLCSGQSNMYYPLDNQGWVYLGVTDYTNVIANANIPTLRYMAVGTNHQMLPADHCVNPYIAWTATTPTTAGNFSAIAYYFGKKLDSALHIPIGLLVSCVGGSACEAWTSSETITGDPVLNANYFGKNEQSLLYNGMINPLKNVSVKGILWDQGESNQYDTPASNYTRLNSAMIKQWRTLLNQGDLPYYFVQMIPTHYDTGTDYFYAEFREAQANIRNNVTKSGMAVTMDINSLSTIHWPNKEPVADRLAKLALHNDYGFPVIANGPSYLGFKVVQPGYIAIGFNNATTLHSEGPLAQVFYVAGADQKFYQAQASIHDQYIVLKLPAQVTDVKSIRYAFTNEAVSNLYNSDNLPVEPFRTDNW